MAIHATSRKKNVSMRGVFVSRGNYNIINREIRVESRFHYRFHYLAPEPVMRQNNKSEIVELVSHFPIIVDFGAFTGN
jgi:hypothetical protein